MNWVAPGRDGAALAERSFQSAYARLLTSTRFRKAVFSRHGSNVDGFDAQVIERLRAMDWDRTSFYAELLVGNRIASISEAFPTTAFLLGSHLTRLARDFGDESGSTDHRKYPEACAIAAYLMHSLETQRIGPPFAIDVLTYELAKLRLRYEYRLPLWAQGVCHSASKFDVAMRAQHPVYVHRHPYQAILSLACDIEKVCADVAAARMPRKGMVQSTMLLLHVDDQGVLHQEGVNAVTAAFLLLADGQTTFDSMLDALATLFAQGGFERGAQLREGALQLCGRLLERGVVGLTFDVRPRPASAQVRAP